MQEDIYKRSKAPLGSVLLLFGTLLVAGVAIGGLASLIANFIYLILIFPAIMGAIAGSIIKARVISGKIRSTLVVVLAGIFAAVLIYGSMHFFDYLQFRNDAAKEIQKEVTAQYGEAAANEDVQAYIDYVLVKKTGFPGFIGFVLLEAQEGVSISEVGPTSSGSTPLNLGKFTWIYWLVEMGFIGGVAISSAYKSAQSLFCEHCDAWVPDGEHIGGLKPEFVNQAIDLLKRRDFVGLSGMLRDDTGVPSVEFYTCTCKTCNTFPFYVTGFALSPGRRGQVQSRLIMAQALNSSERFALTNALATRNTAR